MSVVSRYKECLLKGVRHVFYVMSYPRRYTDIRMMCGCGKDIKILQEFILGCPQSAILGHIRLKWLYNTRKNLFLNNYTQDQAMLAQQIIPPMVSCRDFIATLKRCYRKHLLVTIYKCKLQGQVQKAGNVTSGLLLQPLSS